MGKTSNGVCESCKKTFSKMAIARHLQSCPGRTLKPGTSPYYLLSAQGRYSPEYWLYFEASADETLQKLDDFLRNTWLECCGHMSTFEFADQTYCSDPDPDYGDKSMRIKLGRLLYKGLTFRHEYDMGSTTELTLKVVGERTGVKRASGIELLARNAAPVVACTECKHAEAAYVCSDCQYDESGWLCESCAENHECGEDMLLPVVNSPRVGVCDYSG